MEQIIIIHSPNCSKSRCALELIQTKGIKPQIIKYIQGELTEELLTRALTALKLRPKDVLRLKDVEALNLKMDQDNDSEVFGMILKHPEILERPIIVRGDKAVIGRPPENVLPLLG